MVLAMTQVDLSSRTADGGLNFRRLIDDLRFIVELFEKVYCNYGAPAIVDLENRLRNYVGVNGLKEIRASSFVSPSMFPCLPTDTLVRSMSESYLNILDFCSSMYSIRRVEAGLEASDSDEGEESSMIRAISWVLESETVDTLDSVPLPTDIFGAVPDDDEIDIDEARIFLQDQNAVPTR